MQIDDSILLDDAQARAAFEAQAVTPLPGTKNITPQSLFILDQIVGESLARVLDAAEKNRALTRDEFATIVLQIKSAGETLLELAGPVLEGFIEQASNPVPQPMVAVEGLSFNEQDRIDIDIAFSVARDAMRSLGWSERVIEDYSNLQYRLRLAAGAPA